jgi:hypothetical protein
VHIRDGWTGEYEPNRWGKVNVDLAEEDLLRLVIEAGIPHAVVPSIPVRMVYELLSSEAEILMLVKLITRYGYPAKDGRARITQLEQVKSSTLEKIRALTVGPPSVSAP